MYKRAHYFFIGSSPVLIGVASSASIAFVAILSIVIIVCNCYHRKIRSINNFHEHTYVSNIERNMYQGKVFYDIPQQPNDFLPYIEIIENNENHNYYSRPPDASTEEDDGYMKPEDETECPYDTIDDVFREESQNDQKDYLCQTSEDETNIEDGNTAEIDVDLKEEKMNGVDNKNVKISIGSDKKEYKSNPNIDKRAV